MTTEFNLLLSSIACGSLKANNGGARSAAPANDAARQRSDQPLPPQRGSLLNGGTAVAPTVIRQGAAGQKHSRASSMNKRAVKKRESEQNYLCKEEASSPEA